MTVQRADLEAKLLEIQEAIEETSEGMKNNGVMIAVGVAVLVLLVYLAGRRKGRKGSTRVEVYRLR
jgi:LPXTG-motif cell wall-anchored protein